MRQLSVRAVAALGLLCYYSIGPATAHRFGMMSVPEATLAPRYYGAASPALLKRQASCPQDFHSCLDIGSSTECCPDTSYCIVDPATGAPQCCPIGSTCDSKCPDTAYDCNITSTVTVTATATTATASLSIETIPACCPRQCASTSYFLCPSSLGGGCCLYGATCATGSQCLYAPSTTTTLSSFIPEAPPGCTTGQIGCPDGGCCNAGFSCTVVGTGSFCAPVTVHPTGTGITVVPQSGGGGSGTGSGGLSAGAKAGIAVGVIVGAAVVVGALTWWFLRGRRRSGTSGSGDGSRPAGGYGSGGPEGPAAQPSDGMSEVVSQTGPLRGIAHAYHGPTAVEGPYTMREGEDFSSPTASSSVVAQEQQQHGMVSPVAGDGYYPQTYTAGPVELASEARSPPPPPQTAPGPGPGPSPAEELAPQSIEDRFELADSELAHAPHPLAQVQGVDEKS